MYLSSFTYGPMINMSCSGGHLGFLVNNKILKDHPRKVPAKCDFKWFSVISQYLKIISTRVIPL
jgi:hypothetical protein